MRGKQWVLFVIITIFLSILFFKTPNSITLAKNSSDGQAQLEDGVDETLEKLDTSGLEEFFSGLTEDERGLLGEGGIIDVIKNAANGTSNAGFSEIMGLIVRVAASSVLDYLPALLSVIIIAVLYGLLSGLNSGFLNASTNRVVYFACYGAAVVVLMNEVVGMVNLAYLTAQRTGALAEALFPVLLTLMTALGGVSGAGLLKPVMATYAVMSVSMIKAFILPCFAASVIFAVVGNLTSAVKLQRLTDFFKKLGEYGLILIFGVFLTVLTAKGIVGRTVDGVAVNAAKFAVSSYVPILGGYISDGFDVVMASCILIKNAVGFTGLFIALGIILVPITKLAVFSVALRLTAAIIEPVGGGKLSEFVSSLSKSMGLLIASLLGVAFMFFALIMLVASSCNLGVL